MREARGLDLRPHRLGDHRRPEHRHRGIPAGTHTIGVAGECFLRANFTGGSAYTAGLGGERGGHPVKVALLVAQRLHDVDA